MENMNPTSIVEPLKKMSITTVEPSTKNPSIQDSPKHEPDSMVSQENGVENFSFQVYPAITIKQALAALCEENFNPKGLAMFEVGELGLEITARNSESGGVGHLWLMASGLIDFQCSKAMVTKWINLNNILKNLVNAADKDTISIYHLEGSNQLLFSFGSSTPTQFSEKLLELGVCYEKFPKITYAVEAVMLSEHLKQMIQKYEAAVKFKFVSVEISERAFRVLVDTKEWLYHFNRGDKDNGIRGAEGQQKHRTLFLWPDCEFLKMASLVAPALLLCLTTDPHQHIMLRFNLRELGDLVYLNKSEMTILSGEDYTESSSNLSYLATAASLIRIS